MKSRCRLGGRRSAGLENANAENKGDQWLMKSAAPP
jgi:hypothetical protein